MFHYLEDQTKNPPNPIKHVPIMVLITKLHHYLSNTILMILKNMKEQNVSNPLQQYDCKILGEILNNLIQ